MIEGQLSRLGRWAVPHLPIAARDERVPSQRQSQTRRILHDQRTSASHLLLMVFLKSVGFRQRRSVQYLPLWINLTRFAFTYLLILGADNFQLPWSEVKKEMTEEKGLDPAVADKIGEYVKHKGMFTTIRIETV